MYSLARVLRFWKNHGVAETCVASIRHLTAWFLTKEEAVITCTSLDQELPTLLVPEHITFRRATSADLPTLLDLATQNEWTPKKRECRRWLESGDFVLLAFSHGQPIGYCCVTKGIHPDGRVLKGMDFDDRDGWGRDAFVLRSHRGCNIYPLLALELLKSARADGYRRVFGRINLNNTASRSAHRKIGAEEIRAISLYKIRVFRTTLLRVARDLKLPPSEAAVGSHALLRDETGARVDASMYAKE